MWIHIPISLASTQESVDSTSLSEQCLETIERSLTVKGKSRQPKYWKKELVKDYLTRLRSTLMLSRSQQNSIVARWIGASAVSPASHSLPPVNELENLIVATSGPIPSDSFANWDHDTYSWRTSQASLLQDTLEPYSGTWPKHGSMRSGAASQLPKSEQATRERGSSSWPTPRTQEHFQGIEATNAYVDAGYRQPKTRGKKTRQGGTFDTTLSTAAAAKNWPTPNAGPQNDGDTTWMERRERIKKEKKNGNGFGLTLGQSTSNWGTPTTRDHKDGSSAHTVPEKGHLGRQAPNWINSQSSHPDPKMSDGDGSSSNTQNSHKHSVKCMRLNPKFVTWMMLGKSRIGWLR